MKRVLSTIDRNIGQKWSRIIQEAFSDGLEGGGSIGVVTPADREGIKMEWDFGVTPVITGDGKMVHGLDIKMVMDKDYSFTTKKYNATVRGARLQAYSQDNIGGRLMGAFIAAQAQGVDKTIEGYISGETGPGMIGIEARTELATNATITTPAVAGILIYHHQKGGTKLTGGYRGLQIETPLLLAPGEITGTVTAIHIGEDWGGTDHFDYVLRAPDDDSCASPDDLTPLTQDSDVGYIKVLVGDTPMYIGLRAAA